MKVSFDFDNTLTNVSWDDDFGFIFKSFNIPIIRKMQDHISKGDMVFILTSRNENAEKNRPQIDVRDNKIIEVSIQHFMDTFDIGGISILFADKLSKKDLIILNDIELHHEDDIIEINDIGDACVCVRVN